MFPSPTCRAGWRWMATSSGTPIWPTFRRRSIFIPAGPMWKWSSIPGDLSIDSGDLQLNNATGPARISTSAKDVECTGITGDLRVEDGDGDISVGAVAPLGELQIHNRNGAINLTVPQGAGFQLQATARNGNIDSKLDLPVTQRRRGPEHFRAGGRRRSAHRVGGRSRRHRDHRDGRSPAPGAARHPSPRPRSARTARPGAKSMRHLRPPQGRRSSNPSASSVTRQGCSPIIAKRTLSPAQSRNQGSLTTPREPEGCGIPVRPGLDVPGQQVFKLGNALLFWALAAQ